MDPSPPDLSNIYGSMDRWSERVAIVPWGKVAENRDRVVLSTSDNTPFELECPGDLNVWAKSREAWVSHVVLDCCQSCENCFSKLSQACDYAQKPASFGS